MPDSIRQTQVISNLPGKVLASPTKFLQTLANWATSPSHQFLWMVNFEVPNDAKGNHFPLALRSPSDTGTGVAFQEHTGLNGSGGGGPEWNVWKDNAYFNTSPMIHDTTQGCMVVQGINIPGEQVGFNFSGVSNRGGLLPVMSGSERLEPQELTMAVYEGNASFIDTVIRPWVILSSHYGLVAREYTSDKNVKVNITITQFAKTVGRTVTQDIAGNADKTKDAFLQAQLDRASGSAQPAGKDPTTLTDENQSGLIVRKRFRFYNACPVRMDAADLTHNTDQGLMVRNVTWAYSHYTVHNFNDPTHPQGTALKMSEMLANYYDNEVGKDWKTFVQLYQNKWNDLEEKFAIGARPQGFARANMLVSSKGRKPRTGTFGADSGMTLTQLKKKWKTHDDKRKEITGYTPDGSAGKRGILLYGPRGDKKALTIYSKGISHAASGTGRRIPYPEPGATFETRWRDVGVTNLCNLGGKSLCKPPPPPPQSALSKIRGALRNLTKLARNARGFGAAFKRVGKAKGVKGKLGALGDLNKSFGSMTGKTAKSGGSHKTLGGGMPKTKSSSTTTKGLAGAISVVDDAQKAAKAITGGSRG